LLFAAGLTALTAAWLIGEPPFASPDEHAHYLRALSIPEVGLLGEPVPDYGAAVLTPQQLAIVRQEVRRVRVGPHLSPGQWSCFIGQPGMSAACLDVAPAPPPEPTLHETPVGTYPPVLYVAPGLVGSLARDPGIANVLASAVSAALAVAFLWLATVLLWRPDRGGISLAGLVVAATPMALYVAASLNPSGPEIAAGIAFSAGLLRLARQGTPPPLAWAAVGVAGAVLVVARTPGPVWLVAHVLAFLVWSGRQRLGWLWRHQRGPLLGAAALVGGATAAAVAWAVAFGTDYNPSLSPFPASLGDGWALTLEAVTRHAVAVFGYLEYNLPGWIYNSWQSLVVALLVLALVVGTGPQRVALLLVIAGTVLAPVLLQAAILRHTGFPVQGRHLLPLLVVVPLLAGETVADRASAGARFRVFALAAGLTAAAVHVGAWYGAARRAAVGIAGTWAFIGRSQWNPPLGWSVWALCALAGATLLVVACAAAPRASEPAEAGRREPRDPRDQEHR